MKIKLKKELSVLMGEHHGVNIPAGTTGSLVAHVVVGGPPYFVFDLPGFKVFIKSRDGDDMPEYEELVDEKSPPIVHSNETDWTKAKEEHYAKLKPYQINGVCPKCNSANVSTRFKKISFFGNWFSSSPTINKLYTDSCYEVIDRQCYNCTHCWQEVPLDACKKSLEPPAGAAWSLEETKKAFENGANYVYCTWADAQKFKKVTSIKEAIEFYTDGRYRSTAEPNCEATWNLTNAYHAFERGVAGVFCLKPDRFHLARTIEEAKLFFSNDIIRPNRS